MKPVDCLTADDCVAACLESVLELPAGSAPRGLPAGDLTGHLSGFLAEHGLAYVHVAWNPHLGRHVLPLLGYYLLVGPAAGGGRRHAVVALAGEVVHDPNPRRIGLTDDPWAWEVGLLVAKDPRPYPPIGAST